ncbi:DUF5606 family protein [Portibacter lacus]|uniref:DUF5606 domain-containing protein n=1 Tax=Portibacter lacus TaxID=1099794 RepID=A0AA37SNJ6_9BACT|nr:DUF5606 domain-containing protein [Portibacter lacus]GLR18053.1 hypothetical protein GCM10007940_26680 [Portibacter lacus]
MNLEKYVAVSGMPGIFKLVSTRNNGLLVADMDTEKTKFYTMRKHQFTPLGSVAIYTYGDAVAIGDVFKAMHDQQAENPILEPNAPAPQLFDYFDKILPDFDRDRVFISDIKKVIKWYNFLDKRNALDFSGKDAKSEEE